MSECVCVCVWCVCVCVCVCVLSTTVSYVISPCSGCIGERAYNTNSLLTNLSCFFIIIIIILVMITTIMMIMMLMTTTTTSNNNDGDDDENNDDDDDDDDNDVDDDDDDEDEDDVDDDDTKFVSRQTVYYFSLLCTLLGFCRIKNAHMLSQFLCMCLLINIIFCIVASGYAPRCFFACSFFKYCLFA